MATTYKCTLDVRCWKEHTCLNCTGRFAYLLVRKVVAQGSSELEAAQNAQKSAASTIQTGVEQHPCPTCGLYQPDMVGGRRATWHGRVLALTGGSLIVLAILYFAYAITANQFVWSLAVVASLMLLINLFVVLRNPNKNPQANQNLARDHIEAQELHSIQIGTTVDTPTELFSPGMSGGKKLLFATMFVGLVVIVLPEVVRIVNAWPLNDAMNPPVVGPGDEIEIRFAESVQSIKSYWAGRPTITATIVGEPNEKPFGISGASKQDVWGDQIQAKKSEKNSYSRLWVTAIIPNRADLAGKTLQLQIKLNVTCPAMNGLMFMNSNYDVHKTINIQLASVKAGATYDLLWWIGFAVGGGLVMVLTTMLRSMANRMQDDALETNVYAVGVAEPIENEPDQTQAE